MAKKDKKEEFQLTDEQMEKARVQMRDSMREKFDKWMNIYDEDATKEDIEAAKKDFDDSVALYQDKTYVIIESDALPYAKLLKEWHNSAAGWVKGSWKGVIMFDSVISDIIKQLEEDNTKPFEIDYSTLMYLYQTMSTPQGTGLESALQMSRFENYNPITDKQYEEENYVTYSHIFQNIINVVNELTAVDKMLKLKRERINIMTAGVKFDWKISEVEEFIELHNAWVGTAVPDDEAELQ